MVLWFSLKCGPFQIAAAAAEPLMAGCTPGGLFSSDNELLIGFVLLNRIVRQHLAGWYLLSLWLGRSKHVNGPFNAALKHMWHLQADVEGDVVGCLHVYDEQCPVPRWWSRCSTQYPHSFITFSNEFCLWWDEFTNRLNCRRVNQKLTSHSLWPQMYKVTQPKHIKLLCFMMKAMVFINRGIWNITKM